MQTGLSNSQINQKAIEVFCEEFMKTMEVIAKRTFNDSIKKYDKKINDLSDVQVVGNIILDGVIETINGLSPDAAGNVTLTMKDIPNLEQTIDQKPDTVNGVQADDAGNIQIEIKNIPGLTTALKNQGGITTVNKISPDEGGNIDLNADAINVSEQDERTTAEAIAQHDQIITTMGADEFDALTQEERLALYEQGVRVVATENETAEGKYVYFIDDQGNAAPSFNQTSSSDGDSAVIDAVKIIISDVLLAINWGETVPYTQSITVEGITDSDEPHIFVDLSDATEETVDSIEAAWSKVKYALTSENTITFYCIKEVPTVDIPIHGEVIRTEVNYTNTVGVEF